MTGTVLVSREHDEAFRKMLERVAPANIRPKIRIALMRGPDQRGRAFTEEYFGKEFPEIAGRAAALADWLDQQFAMRLGLPGLIKWLDATGFGNDFRLIKAFAAWGEMALVEQKKAAAVH